MIQLRVFGDWECFCFPATFDKKNHLLHPTSATSSNICKYNALRDNLFKRRSLSCPNLRMHSHQLISRPGQIFNTRKFSPPTGGFFLAPAEGDFAGRMDRRTDNGFKGVRWAATQEWGNVHLFFSAF